MVSITSISARIIFNSRGSKAIEVDIVSEGRFLGRASSPSGASVGKLEAQSFTDNSPEKSLSTLNSNAPKFVGADSSNLREIFDIIRTIDNTTNYSKIGGSVAYAVSIAAAESAARANGVPLFKQLNKNGPYAFPFPLGNILGGGAHAGPGTPDIQEILVCPKGAKDVLNALQMNFKVHAETRKVIESIDKRFTYGRGDEGAWAPNVSNDQAIEIVESAVKNAGFVLGKDVSLGIDFASSSLWNADKGLYDYARQGKSRNRSEQIEYVNTLIRDHKLIYAEDPVQEEDFEGMAEITKKNPGVFVTGDDMLVTNATKVQEASNFGACNAAILKVNQAGTLYDAMLFAKECATRKIRIITSHRSGESVDSHISHIAVATNSKMLKSGVLGGERVSKLNELIRLSEHGLINGMAELTNTI